MAALAFADVASDVIVVGGSGRVGASTLRWLDRLFRRIGEGAPSPKLAVGGRNVERFHATKARLGLPHLAFVPLDLDAGSQELIKAVNGAKLVVHTAGPFQGRSAPDLLRACISAGVPYCDVCDDYALSRNGKALAAEASAAGVPAVVSCGIWPGVSALMAASAVEKLGGAEHCDRVELSFHTAGSGGAGPTIVSATFLLLASKAFTVIDDALVAMEPWTDRRCVDFGGGLGRRACFLLDNPDVPTIAEALGIANCSSRFGTAPDLWNGLFGAIKVLPNSLLNSRPAMQKLASMSMPVIRLVDAMVGATNAMRVDAFKKEGTVAANPSVCLRCIHPQLDDCVGQATAAFAIELLRGREPLATSAGSIAPGVWYPVELHGAARRQILSVVQETAMLWEM